jgi:hypothetical protein
MNNITDILDEFIPDVDNLYLRVSQLDFDTRGNLKPDALAPRVAPPRKTDDCGRKSTNWSRHSTPQSTIDEDTSHDRQFNQCAILGVGTVRKVALIVEHCPLTENRAHSIYHTNITQEPRRITCNEDSYAQPSEEQLDTLARYAEIWSSRS